MRGAARAVAATVGAVLAGLVLALPALHLPLTAASTGPQTAVVSSVDHRAGSTTGSVPAATLGLGPAVVSALVAPTTLVAPVVLQARDVPAASRAALTVAVLATGPTPGAAAVLLAAALVGLVRPTVRHRSPRHPSHLGPAPLRGPPAPLAPAP